MKIIRMTATFGRLEGETLALADGLNILTAPNEGGKSTWCAFLRAMLYGIPTRERDTRTTLAEKNRYQPWSGSPMAGEIDLTWRGRDLTLRRFQKGGSPFGGFEAVYTGTAQPVPGLTGENCGEMLLGVPREVFERSAFVGQGNLAVAQTGELEKRIAALVSSGEEDVSYSETEKTLKGWLNRRRHNRTGLIPKLEEEESALEDKLAQMRRTTRRITEAEAERAELERQREALEAEASAQKARQDWARSQQYGKAAAELDAARRELDAQKAEAVALPGQEKLRQAQGDLAYLRTLEAAAKEAQNQREPARRAVDEAEKAAFDPLFQDMDPDGAWKKASEDAVRISDLEKKGGTALTAAGIALLLAAAAFTAAGVFSQGNYLLFAAAGLAAVAGTGFLLSARRGKQNRVRERGGILARYGAQFPDDLLSRANAYREKWVLVEEAKRQAEAIEGSIRELSRQREELWRDLLAFAHSFAPTATDPFGVSAALSRALSMAERLSTARVKAEAAQKLLDSLPPAPATAAVSTEPPPSVHAPAETAAMLSAVRGELSRVEAALAMAQGERGALGDPDALEARREEVAESLRRRREEHQALSLALEALAQANEQLQTRFSPELNRRAGEIFRVLTGGKYEDVTLNRELEASARAEGDVLPHRALSLSQGTADQLYLAVRLAVCDMALPGDDPAPLVLDDALVSFDDARMALALDYLHERSQSRQILLFTCQSREKALAAQMSRIDCKRHENFF